MQKTDELCGDVIESSYVVHGELQGALVVCVWRPMIEMGRWRQAVFRGGFCSDAVPLCGLDYRGRRTIIESFHLKRISYLLPLDELTFICPAILAHMRRSLEFRHSLERRQFADMTELNRVPALFVG